MHRLLSPLQLTTVFGSRILVSVIRGHLFILFFEPPSTILSAVSLPLCVCVSFIRSLPFSLSLFFLLGGEGPWLGMSHSNFMVHLILSLFPRP